MKRMSLALVVAALGLGSLAGAANVAGQSAAGLRAANVAALRIAGTPGPAAQSRSTSKLARMDFHRGRAHKSLFPSGGHWTVAEGKRRARKQRNRQRHKRNCGQRS